MAVIANRTILCDSFVRDGMRATLVDSLLTHCKFLTFVRSCRARAGEQCLADRPSPQLSSQRASLCLQHEKIFFADVSRRGKGRRCQRGGQGGGRGFVNTPPSKNITGSFFVCGINFVGVTRKIGNLVTGNHFSNINFPRITGNVGRSQRSVRRCELGTNRDYRKYQ